MFISYLGRETTPTVIQVNRKKMVVQMVSDENSMTALFPVAPNRYERVARLSAYPEKSSEVS